MTAQEAVASRPRQRERRRLGLVVAFGLTIRLDVSTWFVNSGALIDPTSANVGGPNEGIVHPAYAALWRGRWIISDQSGRQPQFLVGTQAAETW